MQSSLGGITRLTDSGLSITEWQPILGVVPPTDEAAWDAAFAKYQAIPQHDAIHPDMTLVEFKVIYFWEWLHRLWGRLLGVAFIVPFAVLLVQGHLRGLTALLLGLFLLGGLQGALGWYMVASGLSKLVYVSHLRLAAHFMLAMALLVALLWNGLRLLFSSNSPSTTTAWRNGLVLGAALAAQLTLGAFMAGLKAALVAPTWPTINGRWLTPIAAQFWDDALSVQFLHRGLGYLVVLGTIWWAATARALRWERWALIALVVVQVALGAAVLLRATDRSALVLFGALHQATAVALVATVTMALVRLRYWTDATAPSAR